MTTFTIGTLVGGLTSLAVLIVIYLKHRKERQARYDERQKMLRGKIAQHTLIFAVALLLISGALSEVLPHWLSLSTQNLLIIMLTASYFVIEQVFRGSYFSLDFSQRRLRLFTILWIFYTVSATVKTAEMLSRGVKLSLSGDAFLLISYWWLVLMFGVILSSWYWEHRKK